MRVKDDSKIDGCSLDNEDHIQGLISVSQLYFINSRIMQLLILFMKHFFYFLLLEDGQNGILNLTGLEQDFLYPIYSHLDQNLKTNRSPYYKYNDLNKDLDRRTSLLVQGNGLGTIYPPFRPYPYTQSLKIYLGFYKDLTNNNKPIPPKHNKIVIKLTWFRKKDLSL